MRAPAGQGRVELGARFRIVAMPRSPRSPKKNRHRPARRSSSLRRATAARVGLSPDTIRKYVRAGMPAPRYGRLIRIKPEVADLWIETRSQRERADASARRQARKGRL